LENTNKKLLEVNNLKTYFYQEDGIVKAVDDISFHIDKGETIGIVGESGCGKSITSLSVLRLVPRNKGKIAGGTIKYYIDGENPIDITALDPRGTEVRKIRGKEIAMIFQEPMTSLHPVFTVGNQIIEVVRLQLGMTKKEARERAIEMLRLVGIASPEQRVDNYPHELSGGMRQRVMIAMALSCDPNLLIADEPTTALDVTIEAQILDLMQDLQNRIGMAIMFITHDLQVIGEMSDRVNVMYAGKIVETGTIDDIYHNSKHPYTQGLLKSIPQIGEKKRLVPIKGTVPNTVDLPSSCYFAPRCEFAMEICHKKEPPDFKVGSEQIAKCWLHKSREEVS